MGLAGFDVDDPGVPVDQAALFLLGDEESGSAPEPPSESSVRLSVWRRRSVFGFGISLAALGVCGGSRPLGLEGEAFRPQESEGFQSSQELLELPVPKVRITETMPFRITIDGKAFGGGEGRSIRGLAGLRYYDQAKKSGADAMRTWSLGWQLDNAILQANEQDIKVSAGIDLPRDAYMYDDVDFDIKPTLANGWKAGSGNRCSFDDPRWLEIWKNAEKDIRKYRSNPHILWWTVGNELESFVGWSAGNDCLWNRVEWFAKKIKAMDWAHPVGTVIAGFHPDKVKNIKKLCPSLDFIGVNAYGNDAHGLGPLLQSAGRPSWPRSSGSSFQLLEKGVAVSGLVLVGALATGKRRHAAGRVGSSRNSKTVLRVLLPGKSPSAKIRNFAIIAHIDHGKSTLADRLLEVTGTVKKEDMNAQVLDTMDIERERGITIKLMTARMNVKSSSGEDFVLNLIDTPGHVDFTYEVSRSLAACEGALLIVDATQGVEAQTIANVTLAMEADLTIIPVLNKVDLPTADCERVCGEIEDIIGIDCSEALRCSAKTGMGVPEIIQAIIEQIPPPPETPDALLRMLVFDSFYDNYRGVIAMFRVVDGTVTKGQRIRFFESGKEYPVEELGIMVGGLRKPVDSLGVGEVGYLCASIKQVADARVGDTIIAAGTQDKVERLPGYTTATPMVFCGLFPEDSSEFDSLKTAFDRLSLNDAAITYATENSSALGLGFRCGFLGMLHMEVTKERIEREYDVDLVVTAPSVEYRIMMKDGSIQPIQFAAELPTKNVLGIQEPYVFLELIVPEECIGSCMDLAIQRRGIYRTTKFLSKARVVLEYEMPMAEMIRDFFSELKSRSRGYASMDYRILDFRENELVLLEIDINQSSAAPLLRS
ncbi:unnamed protein product [Polarella glacialis]|uniref:Translation factor GUF1 homolog, mitochondrial n=1 Tax=Polarella glacialis TaxID=89957 RepID=A0A813HCP4_POLGL|nr:unnamed protein product [Polarella glacialis]